jgi:hypothetical protein
MLKSLTWLRFFLITWKNRSDRSRQALRSSVIGRYETLRGKRRRMTPPQASRVRSNAPSIWSHRETKVVWPDFQPIRVPEEPVCIDLFWQNQVFTSLHLKYPVHVIPPQELQLESYWKVWTRHASVGTTREWRVLIKNINFYGTATKRNITQRSCHKT